MPMPSLTQAKLARKMLRQNIAMHTVLAVYLFGAFTEVEITAGIARLREHCRVGARPDRGKGWRSIETVQADARVPSEVQAERVYRATLDPLTFTARQMGDPLPGYSAAERKVTLAPSIYSDPLDALMFKHAATA